MNILQNTFDKHRKLLREHLNIKEVSFGDKNKEGPDISDRSIIDFFVDLKKKLSKKNINFERTIKDLMKLEKDTVDEIFRDFKQGVKVDKAHADRFRNLVGVELNETEIWYFDDEAVGYIVKLFHAWKAARDDHNEEWDNKYNSRHGGRNPRMEFKTFLEAGLDPDSPNGFWHVDGRTEDEISWDSRTR